MSGSRNAPPISHYQLTMPLCHRTCLDALHGATRSHDNSAGTIADAAIQADEVSTPLPRPADSSPTELDTDTVDANLSATASRSMAVASSAPTADETRTGNASPVAVRGDAAVRTDDDPMMQVAERFAVRRDIDH